MITYMQIINNLRFMFTSQTRCSFQFYSYFIITQKVIIKIMFQNGAMKV